VDFDSFGLIPLLRFIVCHPYYDRQQPNAQLLVRFEHQDVGVIERCSNKICWSDELY